MKARKSPADALTKSVGGRKTKAERQSEYRKDWSLVIDREADDKVNKSTRYSHGLNM